LRKTGGRADHKPSAGARFFAGNSGHSREVALPDFVLNDDAVRSNISPKMIR
jgi:hypothetical protein